MSEQDPVTPSDPWCHSCGKVIPKGKEKAMNGIWFCEECEKRCGKT